MKTIRLLIATIALMSLSQVMYTQDDYGEFLQQARQCLTEEGCTDTEYNTYLDIAHNIGIELGCFNEECQNGGSSAITLNNIFNGHEYVDLGLPSGTLWATCNVGANNPEDYGNYYAWGETSTKSTYDYENYRYSTDTWYYGTKLTKYCGVAGFGNNGFTDNLTALQSGDDPATASWGSGWQTPSEAQWDELLANTTNEWTTRSGKAGCLFTSKKNGQTLFLPASGGRCEFGEAGSYGYYWSRSLNTDNPYNAWYFGFLSNDCYMGHFDRSNGFTVRPVRQK